MVMKSEWIHYCLRDKRSFAEIFTGTKKVNHTCIIFVAFYSDNFPDAKLSQVVNSIRVVGLALQALYNDRCPENSTLCTEMFALNGTLLYKYMLNVTFVDQFNQEMYFDANGDPPAWYDVLNYVGGEEGFRMVGEYRKKRLGKYRLKITESDIMFFDKTNRIPEKEKQRHAVGFVRTACLIKLSTIRKIYVRIVHWAGGQLKIEPVSTA
ncbi:unnamed protein product [Gongylonema pulchrum]|uniref:Receptor ligand binding region domain-containing protein n=1 Tax=Gongylonema pulchrum TaxID=637853 RepID=A0A3P6S9Z0_9BILA|nr:unnamed protein product [Gongylonema pulchrum]